MHKCNGLNINYVYNIHAIGEVNIVCFVILLNVFSLYFRYTYYMHKDTLTL